MAGAFSLHRADVAQFLRSEIVAFVLNAWIAAYLFKEFPGEIRREGRGEIVILVDTDTSRKNVARAVTSQGWQVKDIVPEGIGYRITVTKG